MGDFIKINDFDDIFPYIGGFGLYQLIIFCFACTFCFLYGFIYFGQIFMVLTPPHWCKSPPGLHEDIQEMFGLNLTHEEIKSLTVPLDNDGLEYSKCLRYNVTSNMIYVQNGNTNVNTSWPLAECTYGWEYNYSLYYPTITSQLNWVCEDDWKPPLAQTFFFIGSMFGIPICGYLADHFGRIPITVATNLMGGVFGMASSFSNSFVVFCVLRFIVGFAHESNFMIPYILSLEYVSSSYRSVVANVPIMVFLTASMCSLPWIAYYLADWTLYGIAIHAPFFISIIVPWTAPESARWLLSEGRIGEATHIVEKCARINGHHLSDEFKHKFKDYAQEMSKRSSQKVTWLNLLQTPKLRKRFFVLCVMWVAIYLTYDGHMRHTENIGANIFISFTLMGLVEFPGDLITILCMEWLGRRHTTVWSLVLAGLISAGIFFVHESQKLLLLGLAVFGRFLITISINVGTQYIVEVLPTVGRAQGAAAIHTIGVGMAFVSPYIVYLSKFEIWLPYTILGAISTVGGLICLLLPETLGEKLPDSLEDGEDYFSNQPMCYNPCKKNICDQEIAITTTSNHEEQRCTSDKDSESVL